MNYLLVEMKAGGETYDTQQHESQVGLGGIRVPIVHAGIVHMFFRMFNIIVIGRTLFGITENLIGRGNLTKDLDGRNIGVLVWMLES